MVRACPELMKRSKVNASIKRIVSYNPEGFYQVLSAETGSKHGLNISGLIFDEIHAQKDRKLYDVLTKYPESDSGWIDKYPDAGKRRELRIYLQWMDQCWQRWV